MKRFHSDGKKSKRPGSADSRRTSARRSLEIMALESRLLLTDTTSTVLVSSAPTVSYGQSLTLTATVTDITDDNSPAQYGDVTFYDGTNPLGSFPVSNGTATYESSTFAVGSHDFTADYSGSGSYLPSSSGLSASKTIETVVGTGTGGFSGDNGPASSAEIDHPYSITYNAQGDLFIADAYNSVVREVTPDGVIHTVAGTGTRGYSGDGGAATAAKLNEPEGLAIDSAGDLFISDSDNNVIREVTTDGKIHTVAGTSTPGTSGDGSPATAAELESPEGIAVDSSGDVFVASGSGANGSRVHRGWGHRGLRRQRHSGPLRRRRPGHRRRTHAVKRGGELCGRCVHLGS